MVAAAGALIVKMVIAAFAGMGAATICHPLGEYFCDESRSDVDNLNWHFVAFICIKRCDSGPSKLVNKRHISTELVYAYRGDCFFQMQTEGAEYKGPMDCATQIYQKNGLKKGLYAGISAAYLRQWLYGSVRNRMSGLNGCWNCDANAAVVFAFVALVVTPHNLWIVKTWNDSTPFCFLLLVPHWYLRLPFGASSTKEHCGRLAQEPNCLGS